MSERPADDVFECLVEATGTWRSVANPNATGETALALEARRARSEEARLSEENARLAQELANVQTLATARSVALEQIRERAHYLDQTGPAETTVFADLASMAREAP